MHNFAARISFSIALLWLPGLYPEGLFGLQLVVEGSLQSGRASEAARIEVLGMRRAATEQLRGQQTRAAAAAAHQMQERQLRQNLQEDARQALGEAFL